MAEAQDSLGAMYEKGQGVRQDYATAVKWYRKAADQGYPKAQYDLGFMYANGRSVRRDPIRAYMWLTVAWESESSLAAAAKRTGRRSSEARDARGFASST